jgi:thiol-disulfide isomerase/thioredoxin
MGGETFMRVIAFLLGILILNPAFGAVYEVGDSVANHCWPDVNGDQVCIDDNVDHVRVLLFNVGWCGPCKKEIQEIVTKYNKEYTTKPVIFMSILGEDDRGNDPASFIEKWTKTLRIPFSVVGQYQEYGLDFFKRAAFPSTVILDRDGNVAWKKQGRDTKAMFKKIDVELSKAMAYVLPPGYKPGQAPSPTP